MTKLLIFVPALALILSCWGGGLLYAREKERIEGQRSIFHILGIETGEGVFNLKK